MTGAPKAINDLLRHNQPLQEELNAASKRVIAKGWYVLGTEVEEFEREFAAYCGVAHGIGLANGTEAIELALRAVGVCRGDAVALVANAGGYGTFAVNSIGATPVYVDVDERSHTMDPGALDRALDAGKPKAVIVTHLYGRLAPIEELSAVARRRGVRVIEDCAQAHGAEHGGRRAGSFGDIGCFSFYPTKNLGALGDGGAAVTDDESLSLSLRRLRQYGWEGKYRSTAGYGRNSRLDELQAALLRVKLPRLDGWNARRRQIAGQYRDTIRHPRVRLPEAGGVDYVAHLYVVRAHGRDSLSQHLRANGVPHDIHYPIPDHRQPMMADGPAATHALPVTETLAAEVLTLPCFPEMTDAEVRGVSHAVNSWVP